MRIEKGTLVHNFIPQIVDEIGEIRAMNLIVHSATWNWRQKNQDPNSQFEHLEKGLKQTARPIVDIPRIDLIQNYRKTIEEIIGYFNEIIPNTVVSLCSVVITDNPSKELHLPMMNYHPKGVEPKSKEGLERILKLLSIITNWDTFVFETDRYWHSYGKYLMNKSDFLNWSGLHSNATSLVSPRYFGQSLRDGYTPLRQVGIPDSPVKNKIPILVATSSKPNKEPVVLEYEKVDIKPKEELLKFSWRIVGRNRESTTCKKTSRVIIVNKKNEVLLTKRASDKSFGGMWHIPGGRAEANENPSETAKREISEELGINLKPLKHYLHYFSGHKGGYDVTVFSSAIVDGETIKLDKTENQEFGWFPANNLPKCAFNDLQILESFFGN